MARQTVHKGALVAQIASKTPSVDIKTITTILDLLQEVVLENINSGYNSKINGFLSFELIEVAQRIGRDSKTKEKVVIPACRRMNVKVSNKFQNLITQENENKE